MAKGGVQPLRSGVWLYTAVITLIVLISDLIYLLGYRSIESKSFTEYFRDQVVDYSFATSFFDLMVLTNAVTFLLIVFRERTRMDGLLWATIPALGIALTKSILFIYESTFTYVFAVWLVLVPCFHLGLFVRIVRLIPLPAGSEQQALLTGRARAQTHTARHSSVPASGAYGINANDDDFDDFADAEEYSDTTSARSRATSFGSAMEPVHDYKLVNRIYPTNFTHKLNYQPGDQELMAVLRARFPALGDSMLFRFLVARSRNVDNATNMLRDHMVFRRQYDLDNIYFGYAPAPTRGWESVADCNGDNGDPKLRSLLDCAAASIHKWSKEGQVLAVGMIGNTDVRGIVTNNSFEFCLEFAAYTIEFVRKVFVSELTSRNNFQIETVVGLIDLSGLSMRQLYMPGLTYLTRVIPIYENNYPESLGHAFLVNVPYVFRLFWAIVKPIIPARTLGRIHFLGDNYQEELLKYIPAENLPARWGGLCNCRSPGGCVPPTTSEGYKYDDLDAEGFWLRTLKQGNDLDVPMAVTDFEIKRQQKPMHKRDDRGVVLKWQVASDTNMSFKLLFFEGFNVKYNQELTPTMLIASTAVSPNSIKSGEHVVTGPGTYVLRFSNSSNSQAKFRYRLYE